MRTHLLPLALLTLVAPALHAQTTYSVPGTHLTIQAAIDASINGDTVLVAPGTYLENIDFGGKDISVVGPVGAAATIIDGGMAGITVTFPSGSTRAAVLDGFTITGGVNTANLLPGAVGSGIRVEGSSPTIRNCTVRNNTVAGYGAGIGVYGTGAAPLIERCTVRDNAATGLGYSSGGGISVNNAGAAEIRECTVADNSATTRGGGVYFAYSPGGVVDRCKITRNETTGTGTLDGGAGVFLSLNSVVTVTNCFIWENTSASNGGGVKWFNVTAAQFVNNTITANTGGGAAAYASTATHGTNVVCDFFNCIIWQNGGGAEFAFAGVDRNGAPPDATVSHSTVTGGFTGPGNIMSAPMLLNVASGNLRLSAGSPCINTGTNTPAALPAVDIDGQPRSIGTPDMGADEFAPSSPLLYASTGTISVASPPAAVTYTLENGPSSGVFGVFFGVSGTSPGTMIFGQTVPLNIDFLTSLYTPVAALNGAGTGTVALPFAGLTLTPGLVGITLSSVAMTVSGSGVDFSNDENVRFVP